VSEPRLDDDIAMGRDEVCDECACGEPDTMEEAAFEK